MEFVVSVSDVDIIERGDDVIHTKRLGKEATRRLFSFGSGLVSVLDRNKKSLMSSWLPELRGFYAAA